MKPPKSAVEDPQGAHFETELAHPVDPLVRLSSEIDWASFDTVLGVAYGNSKVGRHLEHQRLRLAPSSAR